MNPNKTVFRNSLLHAHKPANLMLQSHAEREILIATYLNVEVSYAYSK